MPTHVTMLAAPYVASRSPLSFHSITPFCHCFTKQHTIEAWWSGGEVPDHGIKCILSCPVESRLVMRIDVWRFEACGGVVES